METTASASACEMARLPEELLSAAISRTAPRDACRAAAVSPAFRAAAESDAVWSCFLPQDLPPLADGELSPAPESKKALFMRLSDRPVLLADGLGSMWLDRESGAKCYMLSARALHISWGSLKVLNSWMFAGWKYVARYIARCSRKTQLILLWTRFSGPGGIN